MDLAPLDHPQWAALATDHARFARRKGRAAAYPPDVTPMSGLDDPDDPGAWADLASLLDPGERTILMFMRERVVPPMLQVMLHRPILQMIGPLEPSPAPRPPAGMAVLGAADASDMVELAQLTEPGPMGLRTFSMGHWLGVRREGRLVAMAGQRLHLTGLVEVSGVCTHPDARGQGLARDLILHVMRDIANRGERSFLHLKTENAAARALYESLGFQTRGEIQMSVLQAC